MDKIFLKPTPREILVKGSQKEGHLDIFSYDYESDEAKRKLGSLYVVGNVQRDADSLKISNPGEETEETNVSYVSNLIASLAKREYYSNPDLSPKEAFASALKKVNDVVEEFFVNKDVKINIGIFALAGESINISKLGKFKIFLARDNKNIDILNNIDLFTKERVEEKEFSHVVSGRIAPGDKILAFYPGRFVTAREKTLKENFLKLSTEQFLEKIDAIKQEKVDFTCAALYINLNRVKEPALSDMTKKVRREVEPEEEMVLKDTPRLAAKINAKTTEPQKESTSSYIDPEPELPRIIRTEFSLGKKENPIMAIFNKTRFLIPKRQNKIVFFVSLIGVVLISTLILKSIFFISPADKQTASVVSEAQNNIKLAKTKISQNDFLGARKLLMGSILGINSVGSSKKIDEAKNQLLKILDGLDQATEASPVLTEALPKALASKVSLLASEKEKVQGISMDIYEDNLYVLAADGISKIADISGKSKSATQWLKGGTLPPDPILITADGKVYVLNKSGLLTTYYKSEKQKEINTLVLPDNSSVLATTKDSKYLYLINKRMGRIYLISKDSGTLFKTIKVTSDQEFANAYLDQDEAVYLISKDNKIWKIQ